MEGLELYVASRGSWEEKGSGPVLEGFSPPGTLKSQAREPLAQREYGQRASKEAEACINQPAYWSLWRGMARAQRRFEEFMGRWALVQYLRVFRPPEP